MGGRIKDAGSALDRSAELFELKGNLVGAKHVRVRQDHLALV
jgi:hypothetical protein